VAETGGEIIVTRGKAAVHVTMTEADVDRFLPRIDIGRSDECWPWKAWHNGDGYGRFGIGGKFGIGSRRHALAHRVSFWMHHGYLPDDLLVCHVCDFRACQNPAHLFLGTHAENSRDMKLKGRARNGGLRGECHGMAKLTQVEVAEIRQSSAPQRTLAARYSVSLAQINRIRLGKKWKTIKKPWTKPTHEWAPDLTEYLKTGAT
jgi:HNH endonuclease